jgi:threonine/homoserine efflux transporter RhtA
LRELTVEKLEFWRQSQFSPSWAAFGKQTPQVRQQGWLFSVRPLLSIGSGNDNAQQHCAREGHFCRRSSSEFFNTIDQIWARFVTALCGFAGLVIALGFSLDGLDWRGIALAALGAAGYALQFFSGRSLTRHLTPSVMASLVHLAVWPVVLGIVLWQNGGAIRLLEQKGIAVAGYTFLVGVTLCYMLAYMIHMLALRYAPASTIAPIFNVEPIVTTGAAALILGERLSLHQYLGGSIVFGALVGAALIARREERLI